MKRSQLIEDLAGRIIQIKQVHPTRVAIDGPDAAGKTFLAQELGAQLLAQSRPVIRASIDAFHNPAGIRYSRGKTSPEGYYYDSFNYQALTKSLLVPLGPHGSRHYRSAVFDYRTDSELETKVEAAETNAILVFDGVFLLRPELLPHWDLTIFVEAAFAVSLARAEERDAAIFGSLEAVRQSYEQRYIPGQKLYFDECRPKERATVVVDNDDLSNPTIL